MLDALPEQRPLIAKALTAGARHLWSEADEDSRAELFKGARTGADKTHHTAKPGVRTAEDIKAAYGRPSTTKRCGLFFYYCNPRPWSMAPFGQGLMTVDVVMEAVPVWRNF